MYHLSYFSDKMPVVFVLVLSGIRVTQIKKNLEKSGHVQTFLLHTFETIQCTNIYVAFVVY